MSRIVFLVVATVACSASSSRLVDPSPVVPEQPARISTPSASRTEVPGANQPTPLAEREDATAADREDATAATPAPAAAATPRRADNSSDQGDRAHTAETARHTTTGSRYETRGYGSSTTVFDNIPPPTSGRPVQRPIPELRAGEPTITGEFDKTTVKRFVRRKLARIKYCYEKQLSKDPDSPGGTVNAVFEIDAQGAVNNARATGFHPAIDECVAANLKLLEFPESESGAVKVRYPFTFIPPADRRGKARR